MSDTAGTRFTTLTSADQSANIWVISTITMCVSTACFAMRGLSKSRTGFKIGPDECTLIVGWSLTMLQNALIMKSLTLGLGKDASVIPTEHVSPMEGYFFASVVSGIFSLYAVKISMVLLIQRLFTIPLHPFWIAFAVLGIASSISVGARCPYTSCGNGLVRWILAVVSDILTEIVIMVLPMYCIRNIQMDAGPKFKVQASFFSRLAVILFSGLLIWAVSKIHLNGHPSTSIVLPCIFGQLEVCTSLCVASILPCFRMIFQSSEKVPTGFSANGYSHESKPDPNSHQDSIGLASVHNHQAADPLSRTKKPHHSATSSQDLGLEHSAHSTGRISQSSIALSGATGVSQKALVLK